MFENFSPACVNFFAKIFLLLGVLREGAEYQSIKIVLSFPKFLECDAAAYMLGYFCKNFKNFTVLIKHFQMYI